MRYLVTTRISGYQDTPFCETCGYIPVAGKEVLSENGKEFHCIRCGASFEEYANKRFDHTCIAVKDLKNPLYPFPLRTTLNEIWEYMTETEKREFLKNLKYVVEDC